MSCMFNSIGQCISKNPDSIRKDICDYLDTNLPIIDGVNTLDLLNMEDSFYIEKMRNPNTWGGGIELQVACILWNLRINIICSDNKIIEFIPLHQIVDKTIKIHWNGSHYIPIL